MGALGLRGFWEEVLNVLSRTGRPEFQAVAAFCELGYPGRDV